MTNVNDVRAAIGAAPRDPALNVPCAHCRAFRDMPCTTRGRDRKDPHPARLELAAQSATILPFQPRET